MIDQEILKYLLVDKHTTLQVPEEFPFVLLVASGMWYIQTKAKTYMMKRQAEVMGRENYMKYFDKSHQIAWNYDHTLNTTYKQELHLHGGLPEQGHAAGWYSKNLSYKEWYGIACARLAYDELVERNPKTLYQLFVGSLNFPWLTIGAGVFYLYSSYKRVRELYRPDGISVAQKSFWIKVKCASMLALNVLTTASIGKMVYDYYNSN